MPFLRYSTFFVFNPFIVLIYVKIKLSVIANYLLDLSDLVELNSDFLTYLSSLPSIP